MFTIYSAATQAAIHNFELEYNDIYRLLLHEASVEAYKVAIELGRPPVESILRKVFILKKDMDKDKHFRSIIGLIIKAVMLSRGYSEEGKRAILPFFSRFGFVKMAVFHRMPVTTA